ncbi:MAG TPA: hypothetical protein VEK35_00080 [Roseiarcus sp.]|nr:hypothetical protein [Roseiarcus sp.]
MVVREILHTCSNVHVARAALASIGGALAARVLDRARGANLTGGALVVHFVKDFKRQADDEEWDGVDSAAHGADQPILSGLSYILDNRLERAAALHVAGVGRGFSPSRSGLDSEGVWGQ